jgi:transposase
MKAEKVGAAVKGLKQQTDVAAVVWDGARSHRSELVHGVGLLLVGLPPYSPELNPAERVFEEVRRWSEGRVYRSISDKVEAVDMFLTRLESEPDRVRVLAGWDWIEQATSRLLEGHAA